jgi:UDP-N-acetylglucosamine 4,6-dehydratase
MLGKRCLITGGTGSLASAILERAEREKWDTRFTVFARNETRINNTKQKHPEVDCRVGDVQDADFLRAILPGHDLIIHAAAQKVVPLAESNVRNSIMTNVIGTMTLCQVAVESGIDRVITTLTDKCVQATTIYGAGKFLAGGITREANSWGKTHFSNILYGNVIGSSNSILPFLLSQKEKGLPFLITDARCTRFWLRLDDAIDLILLSYQIDQPGTTIIPKAPASKVLDLFKAVDPDWPIKDIGIRPGEKIHELLVSEVEARYTEDKGDYFLMHSPLETVEHSLPDGYRYTSDNPNHTLSIEELKTLLEVTNA